MQRGQRRKGALSGLSVVELGRMVAAPFCAKLLADLGADVVKIELPGTGDPARLRGPFPAAGLHKEKSGLFLFLNTSKRSVTLDLTFAAGRDIFRRLVARADVLVEDRAPGELERLGIGYGRLSELAPNLVMTSITPFGESGPRRHDRCHHLNLFHVGGHSMFWSAPPGEERPPPRGGGSLGDYDGGLTAAVATMAAVHGRRLTGHGTHIDLSKQEAMVCMERVDIGVAANDRKPRKPKLLGGLLEARDGFVVSTALQQHQWEGLVRAMGEPAWTKEEACKDEASRMEHRDEIQPRLEEWASGLDREEIYHSCQAEAAPVGPVRNLREVRDSAQIQARGFFRELDHPEAGPQVYPTASYRFSKTPWDGCSAPLLGEHNEEVLCGELGLSPERLRELAEEGVV